MSYIGKNPEVDSVKLKSSATVPSGTAQEGQVYFNTGAGAISEGLKVYKNSQFISIDKQLGDADTIDLLKASDVGGLQWGVAINSTSTTVGMNSPVPQYNATATGFASTSAFANSSTGNALLTNESADIVFAYESGAANCKNDYFGIQVDVPKAFRGGNLVLQFEYRTEEASGASSDNDFLVSIQDDTNKAQTTNSTTTGSQAAGTSVAVASSTGFAVGDRVRVESGTAASGNSANSFTEAYVTAIADSTHLTFSETIVFPASGTTGIIAANWLIDQNAGQLVEADSDTNKVGKVYSVQFKTEETTAKINISIMNQSTTAAGIDIFIDNILLSANKFLQASSQTKNESYRVYYQNTFWDLSTSVATFDASLLVPDNNTPSLANSKLVSVGDITGPGTWGTVTAIKALQDISLNYTIGGDGAATGEMQTYDSDGNIIGFQGPVEGTMTLLQATVSVNLAKDDYVFTYFKNPNSQYGLMTFTATPQTSPVILLESQDEIFTDWTDYTSELSTTGPANATNTGTTGTYHATYKQKAQWRRIGDSMEVKWSFAQNGAGTASTGVISFPLPSGYSIDTAKLHEEAGSITGTYYSTFSMKGANLVGHGKMSNNADGFLAYDGPLYFYAMLGTNLLTTGVVMTVHPDDGGQLDDAEILISSASGNTFNNAQVIQGSFKVPISGWNSNFNPLLSMPLVEIGRDMEEFQAWQVATTSAAYAPMGWDNVETDTTGSLLSIANASTALVGTALQRCKVTINLTQSSSGSNWFYLVRNQPSSTAPSGWTYGGATRIQSQAFLTASGGEAQSGSAVFILEPGDEISAISGAAGTAFYDTNYRSNFSILVEKDRSSSNMAHIIKPAVAIGKVKLAQNTAGGTSTAGGYAQRTVNTWTGDTWFVSGFDGTLGPGGTTDQFDLEAGTYKVSGWTSCYEANSSFSELVSTDDSVRIPGMNQYGDSDGERGYADNPFMGTFTITASKTFKLWTYTQAGQATYGLGILANITNRAEVYGEIIIEKLK